VRLSPRDAVVVPEVPLYDRPKAAIFFAGVLFPVYLMGFVPCAVCLQRCPLW
jgi:hypothetical protein